MPSGESQAPTTTEVAREGAEYADRIRRTNERLAWYLAFYEVEGVGREYPDRYRARVEAVTAADVQRAARTYLANPTTVILGPR